MRLCVGTDGVKGLLTDIVFDLAGICLRRSGVDAQRHQEFRQRVVPVQHTLGDGHTAGRQGDEPVLVHRDIAVFPQPFGPMMASLSPDFTEKLAVCQSGFLSII